MKREGKNIEIDSDLIVPGDIVMLEAGQMISADLRLIEALNLQVDESALTGESLPAEKNAEVVIKDPTTPLGDSVNTGFMSTLVTKGRGRGVVVETGMNTEVGKIAGSINTEKKSKTPLQLRLDALGKKLGFFAILICLVMFGIAMLQGRNLAEMFLTSVSLAVAVIPEGLAAIVAVVLSIGVTKLSSKHAIVKKLPAVETLGAVNIICTDKTGTLTQNKMTVTSCFDLDTQVQIQRGEKNTGSPSIVKMAKAMILCSNASYEKELAIGDPTEIALLWLGDDLGINRKTLSENTKRVGEFPFDSDRKLMSTLVTEDGALTVFTKGALVSVFNIVKFVYEKGKVVPFTEVHKTHYTKAANSMSNQALRTLAVAYKPVKTIIASSQMEKEMILLGMVGMIDPPRKEVKAAIKTAKTAGITTIMITGDHKNTAFAIARELGMAENIGQAITGKEMNSLSEAQLKERIGTFRIFARVSPADKVTIVRTLKDQGNVVSMTGDGVNDAPSLNAADIGVAMGITGSDVAKQAADLILTDDNFATIVTAIAQGRTIYKNIKKAVIFLLLCNFGEVIAMFIPLTFGLEAPLIASQLLWINLITDSLPAIALGMEPANPEIMLEKPRPAKESIFAERAGLHVLFGGLMIGGVTIAAFYFGYSHHGYNVTTKSLPAFNLEYARTMAFIVLVFSQLFYTITSRSHSRSIFKMGFFSNKYVVGAVIIGLLLQVVLLLFRF